VTRIRIRLPAAQERERSGFFIANAKLLARIFITSIVVAPLPGIMAGLFIAAAVAAKVGRLIVVGVLIALGLEQTVEFLHWRHKAQQAEVRLRADLE
jgi:hypothetical protein